MNQTLFEKIGGKDTVEKAEKILYVNILRDDRLKRFFEDTDMQKQERMMSSFLTNVLGGPSLYTGKNMRRAHAESVKNGLSDEHVNAMMECVSATLHELKVKPDIISEVISTVEKYRDDVLNR
jgi:hemoglobin